MFTTQLSPQLDVKQRKLIAIALTVTERFFYQQSTSLHFSQIRDYQVWRDRYHIAIINTKTHKPIVFGEVLSNSIRSIDLVITESTLWQEMQQKDRQLEPIISTEEIESAWLFFRPLDPTFQSLYQVQPVKTKQRSLDIKSRNTVKKLTRLSKTVFNFSHLFSHSESRIDSIV